MPAYDYKCPECGNEEEKILRLSQSDDVQQCTKCNADMEKVFKGAPGIAFNGRWFKNSGGY